MNQALLQILGYTKEELLARDFQSITHPDSLVTDLDYVRRVLSGEIDAFKREKRYFHASGRVIWAELDTALVRDAAGEPLYFVTQVQDGTSRRQLEEQLRQAQKMEAVGQLAGGVAHDFNNLLTVISGYSELAAPAAPRAATTLASELERDQQGAAARAAALTRQLLAFSRKQVLQPRILDLERRRRRDRRRCCAA